MSLSKYVIVTYLISESGSGYPEKNEQSVFCLGCILA